MVTTMLTESKFLASWLVAAGMVGFLRIWAVHVYPVWTQDGRLAISPEAFAASLMLQIGLTGVIATLLNRWTMNAHGSHG